MLNFTPAKFLFLEQSNSGDCGQNVTTSLLQTSVLNWFLEVFPRHTFTLMKQKRMYFSNCLFVSELQNAERGIADSFWNMKQKYYLVNMCMYTKIWFKHDSISRTLSLNMWGENNIQVFMHWPGLTKFNLPFLGKRFQRYFCTTHV